MVLPHRNLEGGAPSLLQLDLKADGEIQVFEMQAISTL